jgi:hypothetical protein
MSDFVHVISSLAYATALIACLWWADSALRQLDIQRRLSLPAGVRLLIVLAVGALVYSPVVRILNGLLTLFNDYDSIWVKAAELIGALAVLWFVRQLHARAVEKQ